MKKEKTSKHIANIASRIMNDKAFTWAELKSLAASALTQAPDIKTDKEKSGDK